MNEDSTTPQVPSSSPLENAELLSKALLRFFQWQDASPTTAMSACHMVLALMIERQLTDNGARPLDTEALDTTVLNHAGIIRFLAADLNHTRGGK